MWPDKEERLLQILALLREGGEIPGRLFGYALRARNLGLIEEARAVYHSRKTPQVVLKATAVMTPAGAAYLESYFPAKRHKTDGNGAVAAESPASVTAS